MKKLAILAGAATVAMAGAASAADLPRRVAPPPVFVPIPVFSWTGFYAGLHSAYTFSDNYNIRTSGNTIPTANNVSNGFRAASLKYEDSGFANVGGGFGVNYQLTPGSGLVFGAAFDISWTDLSKSKFFVGAPNPDLGNVSIYRQTLDYLGTVNGKIGYAFDRFLVYGTGGLAFGNVQYGASFFSPGGGSLQFIGGYADKFETGYNYGGGVEYAIPENSFLSYFAFGKILGIKSDVTIKAEYIRYDLGSGNILVNAVPGSTPGVGSYTSKFSTEGSIIRAGFNYKFGG